MTPLEELQAAHKRLSELREAAFPGPWSRGDRAPAGWGRDDLNTVACENGGGEVTDYIDVTNVDLIVTLHRTIDAQLVILATAMQDYEGIFVGDCPYPPHVLSLARAINGEAS